MSASHRAQTPVRVLVVDDSALAREVLSTGLRRHPSLSVLTAATAKIALEKLRSQRPDVLVLDLELPDMHGLELLEQVMATQPLPVVICSSIARPGARAALHALELGALEIVEKPRITAFNELDASTARLSAAVLGVAGARVERRTETTPPRPRLTALPPMQKPSQRVVAIGASTGGTEAIRKVLMRLSSDAPGCVIVQHMPAAFTGQFARRLNEQCPIEVREAAPGDVIRSGVALIAPGGRHATLVRVGTEYRVHLEDGAPVSGHRPSVDVLFESVARVVGADATAVLLTGMGADGARGMVAVKDAGGTTIAQSEESCVVFGMPGVAVALGGAQEVLHLDRIAERLLSGPRPSRTHGRTG
jgi:two-component system chemotaxis response regulator CheB